MALRLRVISEHRRPLGERATTTFGVGGGTIGRASDNDWVLPDPQRYVSAHHARIRFSDGHYEIEDTSTNGLFVNEDDRPVSVYGPYRLQQGDLLRLGEYQIAVAIEPETAALSGEPHSAAGAAAHAAGAAAHAAGAPTGLEATGPMTITAVDPVPTRIESLQPLGRAVQTDLGAVLNLDELLIAESPSGRRMGPVNAYGQAVATRSGSDSTDPAPRGARASPQDGARIVHDTADAGASGAGSAGVNDVDDAALAKRIERLARAAARARDERGSGAPVPQEVQTGLEAFCRGAGVETSRLPADAQARLLHLVGRLLREALVGLKDLGRAREEILSRFHIELPADPEDTRPSLVRSTVEELLIEVLSQADSRRLDAVQWIREATEQAKAHERATTEALRAAFVEFIDRFDPAELEARFQRAARRGKASGSGDSRNWALFVEFYRNLTEMPPDRLPHTFVEAFASAYKKALAGTREPAARQAAS